MHKIFSMAFSKVYPLYLTKVEKKGRTKAELDEVIMWLTNFTPKELQRQIDTDATFTEFFEKAKLHENAIEIKGMICGVRIEEIEDPLMQRIRYLDKVVDELAKGRPIEKIKR